MFFEILDELQKFDLNRGSSRHYLKQFWIRLEPTFLNICIEARAHEHIIWDSEFNRECREEIGVTRVPQRFRVKRLQDIYSISKAAQEGIASGAAEQ